MTMVLTCLTRDFIVQASDRRLVYKQGNKIVHKEDDRNKALIYDNYAVFAYTGLATLSNQKSAIDWAAELLAKPPNLHDAMAYLADRATHLMKTRPFSGYSNSLRRLSFVGAGFIHWGDAEQTVRRPAYFVVSNFMNHEGKSQPPPYNKFRAYYYCPLPYDEPTFKLFRAGQDLTGNTENQLNRTIGWYFQRKRGLVRPEAIGRLLARAIQEEAGINKMVGKNVICTFVPRDYREHTGNNREIHIGGVWMTPPIPSNESQQLTPQRDLSERERFMMPPLLDCPRCLYIPGDNSSLPIYKAIHVSHGFLMPELCTTDMVSTIPPVRSTGIGEMEITAGDWSASFTTEFTEGRKI